MAKYVNGKLVVEKITKPIIFNLYIKNGQLSRVTTGAFLGTIPMVETMKNVYEGTGKFRGKTYPVQVSALALGSVPPMMEYQGNEEVEADRIIDATQYISDYRLEKLNEGQIATLHGISTKALHKELVDWHEAQGVKATPWNEWLDALGEVDQALELPEYTTKPIYVEIAGRKVVGADIRATVNGATFAFGEGEFKNCSNDESLLQFNVKAAVGIFPDGDIYYPIPEAD